MNEDSEKRQKNFTFPFDNSTDVGKYYSQMLSLNMSMNVHFQVDTVDVYHPDIVEMIESPDYELPRKYYRKSIPLVKYTKKKKEFTTHNLMDSSLGDIPPPP